MTTLLFVLISQSDSELTEALKKMAAAAERSAEAAERAARAAELAAGIQPAPTGAKEEPAPSPFSGTAGVSLVYLAGNSNALTASALIDLKLLLKEWTFGLAGNAAYGQARASGDTADKVTALQAFGELRAGRSFNDYLGAYLLGGAGLDHVAKVEWRAYGEAGATVTFIKKKEKDFLKLLLSADLGLRYVQEAWFVYYLDADFTNTGRPDPAGKRALPFKLGVTFRYGIQEGLVFTEQLDVLPDVLSIGNFNLQSATSLSVKVIGPLSLQTAFLLRYNGKPAPGAKPLDSQLSLSATVSF